MVSIPSVCVFCGSRIGAEPRYKAAAIATGTGIADRSWRLVYGGGGVGLMNETADAALAGGAPVIGVIPQFLMEFEAGHGGLTDLIVTDGMHDRKQIMFNLGRRFCHSARWCRHARRDHGNPDLEAATAPLEAHHHCE